MTGVMGMHFTARSTEFDTARIAVIVEWKETADLNAFADYFEKQ